MYKLILTEEERKNLILFLERTSMTGKEAIAYLRILQAIQAAEKIEEKEGD